MYNIKKNDYNETIKDLADLLDLDITRINYYSLYDSSNKGINYKRFVRETEQGQITYKSYNSDSTSTYTLTVEDDSAKTTIEASEYDLGYKSIPRINIRVEDDSLDESFIELTVTSFSVQATIGKDSEEGTLTRFISYEDPNFEEACLAPYTCPYELRKFKAGEDQITKFGVEKRYIVLNPTTTFPSLTYQVFGGRSVTEERDISEGQEDLSIILASLLRNTRTISLFDYVFDVIDSAIPGAIDYFNQQYPFFRSTTDKMYSEDDTKFDELIANNFLDIISSDLNIPSDKQKKLPN